MSSNLTGYTKWKGFDIIGAMIERDPMYWETAEHLKRLGIRGVLFDLDDTLIYTGELFTTYMTEYSVAVARETGRRPEEVMEALQQINDEEYKRMGVSPTRWQSVVDRLAGKFPGHERSVRDNLGILMMIYTTVPRIRPGAKVVLGVMQSIGARTGLVTHANVPWTHFKMDHLNLWNYFGHVQIVDENGHKKSEDWKKAADGLGLETEECLFVGDSLSGDIRPGDELGARTMWMPSPWSVYRQGQIPEKTVVINEIGEVLTGLARLR